MALVQQIGDRTVTSKDVLRHWKDVTDMALREPVVVTSHNRPRHVLLAYDHFVALRDRERQALQTADLPSELVAGLLDGAIALQSPSETLTDGDVIID